MKSLARQRISFKQLSGQLQGEWHLAGDLLVEGGLPGGHGAAQDMLRLAGQLRLHLLLGSAQHEGPQHLMQAGDDQQLLLLVQLLCHIFAGPLPNAKLDPQWCKIRCFVLIYFQLSLVFVHP